MSCHMSDLTSQVIFISSLTDEGKLKFHTDISCYVILRNLEQGLMMPNTIFKGCLKLEGIGSSSI